MRTLSKGWNRFIFVVSVVFVLFQIYTSGFGVFNDAFQRSIHMSFILLLCFITKPAYKKQRKDKVPVIDIVLTVIGVAACMYIAIFNDTYTWKPLVWRSNLDIFFAFAIVILVLESGRRCIGNVFIVLFVVFLLYAMFGQVFPGMWGHKNFKLLDIMQYTYHTNTGVWGSMTGLAANLLAIFGIFGSMLGESGGAETFIKIGKKFVGNSIGGSGKVALIGSGLFGMISGQPVANVLATGSFTVPMMKKDGYDNEWTAATVAIGSTGGQIMPPIMGAGAFIMAQLIGVNYADIAKAAIFPALLYYLGALLAIHFYSKRMNIRTSSIDRKEKIAVKEYISVVIPIGFFLFFIIRNYSTTVAACYATVIGLIVYAVTLFLDKENEVSFTTRCGKSASKICVESAKSMISMSTLMASAQLVIVLINYSGFAIKLSNLIVSIGQNNLFLCLVLAMVVCIVLGMGLPATAAYIIGASVLAPSLIQLGVATMSAHVFVFYYSALSNITPPVCSAVYVSSNLAQSKWLKTGFLSCLIALPVFIIPFAFVYCNGMLFLPGSSIGETAFAFASAIIGVLAVALGVSGYLRSSISMVFRVIMIICGILMVTPFVIPSVAAIAVFAVMLGIIFVTGKEENVPAAASIDNNAKE